MTKVERPLFVGSGHFIENVNQSVGDEEDTDQQSYDVDCTLFNVKITEKR